MTTRLSTSLLLAILAGFASPRAGAGPAVQPGRESADAARLVLAKVNGQTITLADLRESFGTRHDGHGGLLVGREIISRVVDKAIEGQLLIQEGRRMGIPEEPGFREAVDAYRDTLLLGVLEDRALDRSAEPTAAELKSAYERLPRQIHIAVIETRERSKADEARLRIRVAGESFERMARQISVHQSRLRGGDLGWVTWGTLDPITEKVAFSTPVGQVSETFDSGGAFRVVQVIEEKNGEPPPFAQIEDRIGAILKGRKRQELKAALLASIRSAQPPVEDARAVAKLLADTDRTESDSPAALNPPDDAVLMKTATGLGVTAAHVRYLAKKSGLSPAAAWSTAADDALLIDEARRRIKPDAAIEHKVALFVDGRLRDQVERTVILKDITLSDAEAHSFYEKNPSAFAAPASFRMRHIVVATRPEAEDVKRLLNSGADFAVVAKERSIDPQTSAAGGEMGWITGPAGSAPPEGVFALAPSQVSGVIQTKMGHAVVQMMEIKPGATPPFEVVRHEVAQRLMIQKQHALREAFVSRLRKVATVTVSEEALDHAARMQADLAAESLKPSGGGPLKRGTR